MNRLTARWPASTVMPATAGIHDFAACVQGSHGWRAFAHHDVLVRILRNSTQLLLRAS
jgi:hypothetical protein